MSRVCSCSVALFVLAMVALMGGCSSSSPPISVSLSPSSPQAIDQSQVVAINATVRNDTSGRGLSWSLTGPGSLTGSTGLSVSYITPTTSITSAQQVTVTATSQADQTKRASVQITVNPYPVIPFFQTLASGLAGTAYSQSIVLTGGTPPFQWSVYEGPIGTGWEVVGTAPDGLTLNTSSGTISGTPTGGGTWYFEATVTDATGVTVDDGFLSIQINPGATTGNPIPFLNQTLVPTAVSPGSSEFTLNVSGTGFVSSATVNFNRTALATTFVDSEHLTATVPAADVENAKTAVATVVNPGPGGGSSNAVYFQVAAPETTVSFAAAANSPLQILEPVGVTAGDFNEDGKPDLVITSGTRVFVFLGNGDGTFIPAAGSPMYVPSPPYDDFPSPYVQPVVAGDFDNSGHLGLAIGLVQNQAVAILFGKGDGTFAYSDTLANTFSQPTLSLTPADFNGDGNLDLVAGNSPLPGSGISPVVLLGYGHGAFNANAVFSNLELDGESVGAGDFNGDGKLDLAVDGSSILLGNGDGTFTQGASLGVAGFATVGDFNADGKLDLAVCNYDNNVTIFLGDGSGNFATAPGSPIAVGRQPQAIVAADFNNDGKLDLAIANNGDGTVTLLLGNGDGTFTQASGSPFAVGQGPIGIATADFNGDGKLDLAVVNATDGTVSILLQQ
ncbi:MAG: FG-GAP-like repeat-containing protein [Candidatus Sulfotelmatobacter sp.]